MLEYELRVTIFSQLTSPKKSGDTKSLQNMPLKRKRAQVRSYKSGKSQN